MKNEIKSNSAVTESQFYMWRTLFAVAHADEVLADEEIRFMMEALEDIPFTAAQKDILKDDISVPQDIEEMFMKISDHKDQAMFFHFARDLVWVDGDFDAAEQDVMIRLKRLHIQNVNVDSLIGNVGLQLESDDDEGSAGSYYQGSAPRNNEKSRRKIVFSFRDRFLKDKIKDKDK